MILNPSLDCSYVVLNLWPNLSLVVLIKLFLYKKKKPCIRTLCCGMVSKWYKTQFVLIKGLGYGYSLMLAIDSAAFW